MLLQQPKQALKREWGVASNAKATEPYHYVIFGKQVDDQHPQYSGVYFEFDDQSQDSVNRVTTVLVSDGTVKFELSARNVLLVRRGVDADQWHQFLEGIRAVFGESVAEIA